MLDSILLRVDLFLLLFMRMMGLFATAPIWSNRLVPVQMRVGLALATALVVSPLFTSPPPMPDTLVGLVPLVLKELLVGMVIGFVAALAFASLQLAGQLLDIDLGLSMMNVLDPMTNTQMPVLGNFLYVLALLLFFAIDGHHQLLKAVMDSYALVPVGEAVLSAELSRTLVAIAGGLFVVGFKIAAPVLAAVFLATVALGVLNRAVPQLNVFVVGMPVQFAVGVFILMLVMPLFVTFLRVVFDGMYADILKVIRLLKG